MKKVWRTIKKIFDVLCWIIIIILAISIVASFVSHLNGTIPSMFGYSIYRVSSGSMAPELNVGDVILGKTVKDPTVLKIGDVVTYEGSGQLEGKFITHEVIVAPYEENEEIMLQTKGVANDIADDPIDADSVVSIMVCKILFLNEFYDFFFSPWGLLTIIGLIILIFIDELIVLIKTITGNNEEKKSESINEIIDRLQAEKAQGSDPAKAETELPREFPQNKDN